MFEMEKVIEVKQGNYGYPLEFTLKEYVDEQWKVKDLTGYTVTLKTWLPEGASLEVTGTCTLDADPTTGKCFYAVVDGDFDDVGKFYGELELTKSGVLIDTYTFILKVLETAPPAS